jgi:hypothetical protein
MHPRFLPFNKRQRLCYHSCLSSALSSSEPILSHLALKHYCFHTVVLSSLGHLTHISYMWTLQVTLFIDLPLILTLASDSVSLVVDSMPTSLIASVTFLALSQSQLWTAHHSPSSSSASLPYLRPLSPVLVLLDQANSTSHLTTLSGFRLAANDFAKFQSCNARLLPGMGR